MEVEISDDFKMGTWNHRVFEYEHTHQDGSVEKYYEIKEVHYDEDGKPILYTKTPVAPHWGEDDDPMWLFLQYARAVGMPFLKESDFGETESPPAQLNCTARQVVTTG